MQDMPKSGDSLQTLVETYASLVYRLAYVRTGTRHDADDIFQEVFLRYVSSKPAFGDQEHEKAWFIRVTVNCCINLHKSAWRKKTAALSDQPQYMQDMPDRMEYDDLKAALALLPEKSRTVIHLHYFEGMTAEDIAGAIRIPASSVRVILSRTRKKLKAYLTDKEVCAHV